MNNNHQMFLPLLVVVLVVVVVVIMYTDDGFGEGVRRGVENGHVTLPLLPVRHAHADVTSVT